MLRRSKRLQPMSHSEPQTFKLDLSPSAINRMFPLEIVSSFMGYCKPKELRLLALICRAWKREAEGLLYRKIYLRQQKQEKMWSCLMVLARDPRKAALVRSFDVYHPSRPDRMLLKKIFAVLPKLSSLVYLGLRIYPSKSMLRSLVATRRRCSSTLTSLNIYVGVYPIDWKASRFDSLRAVVLQDCPQYVIAGLLPQLQKSLVPINTHLICTSFHSSVQKSRQVSFSLFPGFAPGLATWDPRIVEDLIWASNSVAAKDVRFFGIYLAKVSDAAVMRRILEPIANIFKHINTIVIYVQEARISDFTRQLSAIFSSFNTLSTLCFDSWEIPNAFTSPSYVFTEKESFRMAAAWRDDIHTLQYLRLPKGMSLSVGAQDAQYSD